jgi:hypothetical protein
MTLKLCHAVPCLALALALAFSHGLRGPLHTRAKSRDHEIVRAQKQSVQKATPTHLQHHVMWSRILECSVKSLYVTGPSTECYFDGFLFKQVLTHDTIERTNSCERSE